VRAPPAPNRELHSASPATRRQALAPDHAARSSTSAPTRLQHRPLPDRAERGGTRYPRSPTVAALAAPALVSAVSGSIAARLSDVAEKRSARFRARLHETADVRSVGHDSFSIRRGYERGAPRAPGLPAVRTVADQTDGLRQRICRELRRPTANRQRRAVEGVRQRGRRVRTAAG
jgi:hypothetical protein